MKSKQTHVKAGGLSSNAVNWIALGLIFLFTGWKAWGVYSTSGNLYPIIEAGVIWLAGLIFLLTKKDSRQRIVRPFWTNVPVFILVFLVICWIFQAEPDLDWLKERLPYLMSGYNGNALPNQIAAMLALAGISTWLLNRFLPKFRSSLVGILSFYVFFGTAMVFIAEPVGLRIGYVPLGFEAVVNPAVLAQIPYFLFVIPVYGLFRELHGWFARKTQTKVWKIKNSSVPQDKLMYRHLVFDPWQYRETRAYRALFKTIIVFTLVGVYTLLTYDIQCGELFGWGFAAALPSRWIAWPAVAGGVLVFLDRNVYRSNLEETKALSGRMTGYGLLAFASYVLMCQWLEKSANLYVYLFGVPILSIVIELILQKRILKEYEAGTKSRIASTVWLDYEPAVWIIGVLALFAVGTMLNFMPRYLLLVLVIIILYLILNAIQNRKSTAEDSKHSGAKQMRLQTAVNNFWGAAFVVLLLVARNPQLLSPDLSNYDLVELYVLNPRIWIAIGLIVLWFIVSGSFYRIANTRVRSLVRGLDDHGQAVDYQTWINASQIKNAIVLFMAVLLILVFIINEFKIFPVAFSSEIGKPTVYIYTPEEGTKPHYRLVDAGLPYEEAEARCEAAGGHLAVVTSEEENKLITGLLYGSGTKNCYLLGARQNEYGTFEWITGDPFTYTNWSSGEPNNEEEDLLMIYGKETDSGAYVGEWNDTMYDSDIDFYRTEDLGYICEWEADAVMPSNEELITIFGIDVLAAAKEAEAELLSKLYELMAEDNTDYAFSAIRNLGHYTELYDVDHLIYIPEEYAEDGSLISDSLNGTGVGVYQHTDQDGRAFYSVYYGQYKNGMRSGTGKEISRSYLGDSVEYVYDGSWLVDQPNGEGRETFTILSDRYDGLDKIVTEGLYVNGQYYGQRSTVWTFRPDSEYHKITEEGRYGYGLPLGKMTRRGEYSDGVKYDVTAYYRDGVADGNWTIDYTLAPGEKYQFRFEVEDGQIAEGSYQSLITDYGDKIRVGLNENGFIAAYVVQDEKIYCLTYPYESCLTEPEYTTLGTGYALK